MLKKPKPKITTIVSGRVFDPGVFQKNVFQVGKEIPEYDYPIGHSMWSDYGLRAPRHQRYIIGRR